MTLKRVHVNQHLIKAKDTRPLSVKHRGKTHRAGTVEIGGPSTVVYRPERPLPCGARCWIETRAPVTLDGVLVLA